MRQGRCNDDKSVDAVGLGRVMTTERRRANLAGFSRSQRPAMRIEEWCWMAGRRKDWRRCGGLSEGRIDKEADARGGEDESEVGGGRQPGEVGRQADR